MRSKNLIGGVQKAQAGEQKGLEAHILGSEVIPFGQKVYFRNMVRHMVCQTAA